MQNGEPPANRIGNLTVKETARRAQVSPNTVRYYTRIGLISPQRHPLNGYKLYAPHDVSRIAFIQKAKHLGYTLKEIAKIVDHARHGASPCPLVREIIEARLIENRQRLDELVALQTRIEAAVRQWRNMPDGLPDGNSVCHLIESFVDE